MNTIEYDGGYRGRKERQKFVLDNFPEVFDQDLVLDVGSGNDNLRKLLEQKKIYASYINIDLYGNPAIRADLNESPVPVSLNSVDSVLCLDVLEHLDPIHQRFNQLLEVAKKYVLVSLPNMSNWFFRTNVLRGKTISSKYGLNKESPDDRHRWFLNYSEARSFVHEQIQGTSFKVAREFPYYYQFNRWYARFFNEIFRRFGSEDLSCWAYWCLLRNEARTTN